MTINDFTVLYFGSAFYLLCLFFMYKIMRNKMAQRLDALLTVIVERYNERCENCERGYDNERTTKECCDIADRTEDSSDKSSEYNSN